MTEPKYKRILLKLSGEALAKGADGILNFPFIEKVADVLKKCRNQGVEIAVIVGAGNIWRGRSGGSMDRTKADHMGMLATTINALALESTFKACGIPSRTMTAVEMKAFADPYQIDKARECLKNGEVVIFGCGLGMPYFSTDTAAVLRGAEIKADAVLMAKNIDGVYSGDPKTCPDAKRYDEVSYKEVLEKELKALDMSATTFCLENDIKCYAFALSDPENIYRVVMGEKIGTELHK